MKRNIIKMLSMLLVIALSTALFGCSTQTESNSEKPAASSAVFDAESYFKGQTIRIIVGYSPGGGYDNNARLLAPYLQKYIPGNPNILVENMEGAASIVAANYMYSKAEPDGLTIGTVDRALNVGISNLVEAPGLEADVREFKQLGSLSAASHIFLVNSKLPYNSLEDLEALSKTISMGGTGPASVPAIIARMYRDYFGININIVAGYPGSKEAMLALVSGELDAFSINQDVAGDRIKDGSIKPIVQLGHQYLPDVPMAQDVAPTPIAKALAQIMSDTQLTAYPYILPPGTPDDIVNVLRGAFINAATDPELQDKAISMNLLPSPISGIELEEKIENIFNQPEDVVDALKKINAAS